jgi:hypothetical protein
VDHTVQSNLYDTEKQCFQQDYLMMLMTTSCPQQAASGKQCSGITLTSQQSNVSRNTHMRERKEEEKFIRHAQINLNIT